MSLPQRDLLNRVWFQVILGLGLLALLTYLFLWRMWAAAPEDRAQLPARSDLMEVFFPPRYYFAKTLTSGEFPLWNPHVYSGYPQFADPQAATFYPIAFLLALKARLNFSVEVLAFDIGLHFFLAGAFTFLFFRRVFQCTLPALASGIAFEFGGFLTGYPPLQLSVLEVTPWLPATLLAITQALDRRSWKVMAVAGVTMGLVFLAGHPQAYLTIGPITLGWIVHRGRKTGHTWLSIAVQIALFVLFALGGAAVQWLPTLQLTHLSTRTDLTYRLVSEGGFSLWEVMGMFLPSLVGSYPLYVGILTLGLAGLAVYRGQGFFWAGLALAFLLGSLGKHSILFDALYLLERLAFPGYLRNVERLAFGVNFCLAALAGLGLDQLRRENGRWPRATLGAFGGVLGVALIGAWLWSLGPSTLSAGEPYQLVNALVFIGLLVGGALLSLWVNGERRRMTQAAVLALMTVDLMTTHRGRFYLLTSPNEAGELALAAAAPPGYDTFYRLAADQLSGQDFGSVLGVDNVGGKPPLDLKHYRLLLSSVDAYRRNVLLNVEVVATNGLFTDPSYTLIAEAHGYSYYRFSPTLPRAYLVRQIIEVSGPTEAAEKIAAPDFDPWRTALVEGHVALDPGPPLSPTEGAQVIGRTANTLTLAVIAASQRFLVVSEVNYPGWIAEVDGEVTPIVPTNVALRGILLASGTHTVVMRFRPPLFFAGITVSSLTVLCLLIWFSLPLFRRQSAR